LIHPMLYKEFNYKEFNSFSFSHGIEFSIPFTRFPTIRNK